MTFAEKADLARKYLSIFGSHFSTLMIIGGILAIISAILFIISMVRPSETSIFFILGMVLGILVMTLSIPDEVNISSNTRGERVNVDALIVRYHRRLPHIQYIADVNYHKAQKFQGANTYEVSKKYDKNKQRAKKMQYYLKHHDPKAPWLNFKWLPQVKKLPRVKISIKS